MSTACPECESPVQPPGDARVSELIECPGCRSELEVIALTPIALALAPDPEEDWGE
ncbi:lysine biosynthesis protein LysW [Phytohabitans aurantiacus]|jgi:alpha-aminoadipate carrier protein LysW|uniref:Lysine biosynthesis protein LysW n=1 Tax=Phytohabitans aurantiacus TaxID=3016789 RepID=A0ABQ5R8S2_9ACTN|nr:lysine biosynthesis protein LysW [Phytohabitans aurantiacus]GLI02613.1 lysine biosynthesis protein LysW [Phytohabitans aurantiacus]